VKVGFTGADFDKLARVWNGHYGDDFLLEPETLRQGTIDSPVFDWGASCILLDRGTPLGFVAIKKSGSPKLWKGSDPDQAHVCAIAFREPQVGVDLMEHVKAVLRDRGVYKLIFGQDSRHFLPGCPVQCKVLRDFLIIEGFEEGPSAFDLRRDLKGYKPPKSYDDILKDRVVIRPVTEADIPKLRILLNREFPGRWAYDVLNKIEIERRTEFVIGLFIGETCEGFVLTQDASHVLPLGGAVWKATLGEDWCALGPIGIAKQFRNQGLGDALLASSLASLRDRKLRQCSVDWTGIVGFYRRHGLEVAQEYRAFTLRLDI
jgi:ribosomal protein S18 acetylase RimI-like enzyme